jgi:uncharacterized protein HemX
MLSMVSTDLRLANQTFTGRRVMAEGNSNGNGRYAVLASYMIAILQVVTTALGVAAVLWAFATGQARTQARVDEIAASMQKYEADHDQVIHMRPELDMLEKQVEVMGRMEGQLEALETQVREERQQVQELFGMYGRGGTEMPQSNKLDPKR